MGFFEDFYDKSLKVFQGRLEGLNNLDNEFDKKWSDPGKLTALGFGHEQYAFYFEYAFGKHPEKIFRQYMDPVADSDDVEEDWIEVDEDSPEWPDDDWDVERFTGFVRNVALAKAVVKLLGENSPVMIPETIRIDIFDNIDDDVCFAKVSFDADASTEVKEDFVKTFAREEENRELLLKLWSPELKDVPEKEIFSMMRTGKI